MLNFPTKIFIILLIFFIIQTNQCYCQTGAWIPQSIDLSMNGAWFYGAGETVVMVTREYSQYVYFFDINSSQWSVVNCQTTQNFKKYAIKGQVAMVYSDSLLVGYSGITSQWDTVYYQGQPLDPNPWTGDLSYGCGENLAWFVTNQFVYIFDAGLGQWNSHAYSLPFAYTSGNGRFWSRGDYAGIIIFDSSLNIYYNLAYSLHHHDFSELSNGGFYDDSTWEYNHGFIAYWWSGGSDYKFIGYSAFTNQFDVLTLNSSPYSGLTTPDFIKSRLILKTVYVLHQREFLSSPSWYRLHLYGFDTRHGSWVHHTWEYDDSEWYVGTVRSGGQFAIIEVHNSNNIEHDWIYSGLNNSFSWHIPGLVDHSGLIPDYGGSVAADWDSTKIWFYSANSNASHLISYSLKDHYGSIIAENFGITSLIDNNNPDSLYLAIYHEPQNLITHLTIPKFTGSVLCTPYITLGLTSGLNMEVFCYSGVVNDYQLIGFPSSSTFVNYSVKNVLGYMYSNDTFILYDGTTNEHYAISQSISTTNIKMGDYIALVKSSSNTFYTYSAAIHFWEEKSIPENVISMLAGKYVGVIITPLAANRFYAYNGFYGNLVLLEPTGNYAAYGPRVGDMTAVVVCHNTVYAFNPQNPIGIAQPESPVIPERFALYQNYPNPLNSSSTIIYEIPKRDHVKIDLYDIMGRRIKTLYSGQQEPGRYKIKLESSNLSSGIYFYQLQTSEFRAAKHCLILK